MTVAVERQKNLVQVAIQQALAALVQAWLQVVNQDLIIQVNGEPAAVLLPYAKYQQLLPFLEDLADGAEAEAIYQAWQADPSRARPLEDFLAELDDHE